MKVTYDMVGERGGITHWEWTGKADGNDTRYKAMKRLSRTHINRSTAALMRSPRK